MRGLERNETLERFEEAGFALRTFDEYRIPEYMREPLAAYILTGRRCGHFLAAVLENDLKEAVGRADSTNVNLLPQYVGWLYNFAPGSCWGSPEDVTDWERVGGLLGRR